MSRASVRSERLTIEQALRARTAKRRRPKLDVWDVVEDRADLATWAPRLRDDLEIVEFPLRGGGTYVLMAHRPSESYLRMNGYEMEIARRMDGTRTVADLAIEHFEGSGELDLDGVVDLVIDMHRHGMFVQRFVDIDSILRKRVSGISERREKLRKFARTQTVEWRGADPLVRWLYTRAFRYLYHPVPLVVMALIAAIGAGCFFAVVAGDRFSLAESAVAQEGLLLILLNFLLIMIHEAGHALTIVHFGRRVNGVGAQIYFGSLVLFIDSTDSLMLDRRKRITQSASGPFSELVVAGIASIMIFTMPDAAVSSLLYKFAVLNYFVIFLNLVPFLELDGYWILSDILRIPDLRARSLAFLRHDLPAKVMGRERLDRREIGMALYAILGTVFTVFAFVWSFRFWRSIFGPPIGRMWRDGWPTRIVLLFLAALVLAPLIRGGVKLLRLVGRLVKQIGSTIIFRFQRRWRVEAGELIDALALFDELDEDELSDVSGRVSRRFVPRGATVVTQGERGQSFFVVRSGVLWAVDIDPTSGEDRVVAVFRRGDSFGELAVLTGTPRRVTVKASTEADLFEIDKGTFDRLLAPKIRGAEFGPSMQDIIEVKELPAFRHLEADSLLELMEHGAWVHADAGEVLVKAGERGDAFYAIRSGQAEVIRGRTRLGTLGAGDHFGELSLLRRTKRAATVRALTPLVAYRVDRRGFDLLLRSAFRKGMVRPTVVGGTGRVSAGRG